jgi:hypothetical protein
MIHYQWRLKPECKPSGLPKLGSYVQNLLLTLKSQIKQFGFSGEAYGFRCDMAKEGWLQEHDQIGNPYYGSEMYKCGKITGIVENGRYLEKR